MNITIEHKYTKREMVGPFNLCGSAADLRAIRDAIDSQLGTEPEPRFSFGWVMVPVLGPTTRTEQRHDLNTNTRPLPWEPERA